MCQHHGEPKATKKTGTYNAGWQAWRWRTEGVWETWGQLNSTGGGEPRRASWRKWYLNSPEKVRSWPGIGKGRGTNGSLEMGECAGAVQGLLQLELRAGKNRQVSWPEAGGLGWLVLFILRVHPCPISHWLGQPSVLLPQQAPPLSQRPGRDGALPATDIWRHLPTPATWPHFSFRSRCCGYWSSVYCINSFSACVVVMEPAVSGIWGS